MAAVLSAVAVPLLNRLNSKHNLRVHGGLQSASAGLRQAVQQLGTLAGSEGLLLALIRRLQGQGEWGWGGAG